VHTPVRRSTASTPSSPTRKQPVRSSAVRVLFRGASAATPTWVMCTQCARLRDATGAAHAPSTRAVRSDTRFFTCVPVGEKSRQNSIDKLCV
jgi:hypothetical protein